MEKSKPTFLLTCEHAGNELPKKYLTLFKGSEETLYSHKAFDPGALRLARHLAAALKLPLSYTSVSRLLVEANRSLDSDELFSDFSKSLSEKERKAVLDKFYFPHRQEVEEQITKITAAGQRVCHLAIHTFTPALDGEVRKADLGILFDPKRPLEKAIAQQLREELKKQNPERKVLYNSPYPGTDDGFPTYLRGKFSQDQYAGFELEINQKFFLDGKEEVWQAVVDELINALRQTMLETYP
jgi:predicted N-formylglutamate amidohydrolase